jgi:nifR3 family TIM-barrel protein
LLISKVTVPNRVFLAPMSGITDAPFRRLVARLGAGVVVSEMTASEQLAEGSAAARLRIEGRGIGIHVVQLAGCEARWLAEGARMAEACGATIIDINMGCPARQVTSGYAGSALMRDLDHALSLIEATVTAVQVPVTLKMRLGWDDRSINAPELARRAAAAGVQLVTVHGRTRCQFFAGKADWTKVRRIKEAVTIPVVVNGDVNSIADAKEALGASGADAVMIGRGANGRPWFPGQLAHYLATEREQAEPSLDAQRDLIVGLYHEMLNHHGFVGLRHARKHLGWALNAAAKTAGAGLEIVRHFRQRVLTAERPAEVIRHLGSAYEAFACRAAA